LLDEQNADTHHNAGTVGVAGGLEADDDSVIRLAQIDDPQVFEIEQTQQVNIFHELLRLAFNDHAKPREAQANNGG